MKNEALDAENKYESRIAATREYVERFDILETLNNVGNDEVFTPRKVVDEMLDSLPEEVWHNPDYKWLNPATKTGIFEREIALRLDRGLAEQIPDLETRRKHILQDMIFSIGQTKFTANVARRTLYYCSQANRRCDGEKGADGHYVNGYAIGNGTWFDDEEGNVKTPSTDHVIRNGKCRFCGMGEDSKYLTRNQLETYSYDFIHCDPGEALKSFLSRKFFKGDRNVKFDIIVGNPPYQLKDGEGGNGSSAGPIYQKFIENAISLKPKYVCLITQSRWMTTGKGLGPFRKELLKDTHLRKLIDYKDPNDCFPNNDIKAGISIILWDRDYDGPCEIHYINNGSETVTTRYLKDLGEDIYIREERTIPILDKVRKFGEPTFDSIVSSRRPYGLCSDVFEKPAKYGLPEFSEVPDGGGGRGL